MCYQKYISALLVVICIISLSVGCSDTLTNSSKNSPSYNGMFNTFILTEEQYESLDGIFYTEAATVFTAPPQYSVDGRVFKSRATKDILISGGILTASDRVVDSFYLGGHLYQWTVGMGSDNTLPTFDGIGKWSLHGDSIAAFSTTMASPKIINISGPSRYDIPKDIGIQVTWNADSNNTAGVKIVVVYQAWASRREDPLLTTDDISYSASTTDDGSYTISPANLSSFPIGGIINIYVLRSKTKAVTNPYGKNYFIASVARAVSEYKLY